MSQPIKLPSANLKLTVITPEIIRVQRLSDPAYRSYAIEGDKRQDAEVTVTTQAQATTITTSALRAVVDADGYLDVYRLDGTPLCLDYRGQRTPLNRRMSAAQQATAEAEGHVLANAQDQPTMTVLKQLRPSEHLYGLGDKTGFLDKRGYAYDNWNTDDPAPQMENFTRLYKSVPFVISLNEGVPAGLFFDNTFPSHFDLGKENPAYMAYTAVGGALDYYIIAGDRLADVVTNYTYLTGRTPLPQKWTLGYQQSRWSYPDQKQVESVVARFRELKLPLDAIHLDIDYMDGYRVFTVDKDRFPKMKAMVAQLKAEGTKLVTIIDPGVKKDPGYRVYDEGLAQHAFVTTPEGKVYVNAVWPGDAVYPDFGQAAVRKWWAKQHQTLVDLGVSGVWNDMNEPASFNGEIPADIVFNDEDQPATHYQMHNVYGHNMSRGTYAGLKAQTGKRPFVITRAAYAGTQKYSTIWTGDNHSLWAHLQMMVPQLVNLGLSGFAFAGTDIGGFGSDTTPELLVRWVQAATFSPLFRNHSAMGTRAQEPWQFDDETLANYRKALNLRYQLLDYLYDLFEAGTRTGLPIMRPLVMADEKDERAATTNDEFLVGNNLLVAPVMTPTTRERLVYLPAGQWVDWWSGEVHNGNQSIVVAAPLDRLPLFVRANQLLPLRPASQYVDVTTETELTFKLFGQHGQYDHYQDNGADFAYQEGQFNRYHVEADADGATVTLSHEGYERPYRTVKVVVGAQTLTFKYDATTHQYVGE